MGEAARLQTDTALGRSKKPAEATTSREMNNAGTGGLDSRHGHLSLAAFQAPGSSALSPVISSTVVSSP